MASHVCSLTLPYLTLDDLSTDFSNPLHVRRLVGTTLPVGWWTYRPSVVSWKTSPGSPKRPRWMRR